MNNFKVICIGEALVDSLGTPGGNPALDKDFDDLLGGAPANVACGLSKLLSLIHISEPTRPERLG